jgi:hypothetical protein
MHDKKKPDITTKLDYEVIYTNYIKMVKKSKTNLEAKY